MKKLFKFLFFFILFLLLVLLATPFLFKGKIIETANNQINQNINAKASFSDLSLSFFKQFPNLSIGLDGLTLVGIDDFEGDTLISFKSFEIAVNVASVIKMENIVVKKIILDRPTVNAKVLKDGKANWDIAKESEDLPEEESDTSSAEFDTQISLKTFRINHAVINYTDLSSNMTASLEDLNFSLSGDMSKDFSVLLLETFIDKINFSMDGIKYLSNTELNAKIDIDANTKDNIYKLNNNSFSLNQLTLNWDGSVEIPNEEEIIVDLKYSTSNTSFKTLLSLIPAVYTKDFEDLTTSGKLALNGHVKGIVKGDEIPNVDGKLIVEKASFNYPDLPKSAENINIDIHYFVDGKQMDNTLVDVNRFHLELGGNPIDLSLNLKTPISDPSINGHLNVDMDLASLSDVIPLEETTLEGNITAKLDWMGNLSDIEEERYTDFKADGELLISDFLYNSPDIPKAFSIKNSEIHFSPKHLSINSFDAILGSSDFQLNGKVQNYIPYVMKDDILIGNLNFNSSKIDLNELMAESTETEVAEETTDTSALAVVEIPANINFTLKSNIKELYYDDMELSNVLGNIYVKDSKVLLERLQMDAMGGTLSVSGEYNTQDIKTPLVDLAIKASDISIPKAFNTFEVLKTIAPIAENASGNISFGLEFSSFLQENMKPMMNTIIGTGNLKSKEVGIKGSSALTALGNSLNVEEFKNMVLNNLDMDFEIRGSRVFVSPFEAKFGETTMLIAGQQGFDQQMDYGINMSIPRSKLGAANDAVDQLYDGVAAKGLNIPKSDEVNVLAKITGDMSNPKVKLELKNTAKQTTKEIKEELRQTATKAIEEKKDDAKKEARAEADKLIKQAEQEAEQVREEAKNAADKVRKEAEINSDRILNEAKNPIAKKVAEPAAKKVRDEGEVKAQKIESEADKKANKIIEEAQAKADQMLK